MLLNLTQHKTTKEQAEAGVVDLPEDARGALCTLLTFESLPDMVQLEERAREVVKIAKLQHANKAMIGGAPFFMGTLERHLKAAGFRVFYAFSRRESVEQTLTDGSVKKVNVFRHLGFVEV